MLLNKVVLEGTDILLVIFAIYLFSCYFDIFFTRRKKRILAGIGYMVFVIWQFVLSSVSILPVYINISITIIVTFISVMFIYEGGKWNKCIFTLAFNAIWMMIETLSGYVLSIYCMQFINFQIYEILGSVISKLLFLILIFSLKRVFSSNGITEFSAKYSVMLILIPIGSIYVMNEIFLFSYKINSNRAYFHSAVAAIILLCLNVLIFYIYVKLTDDLQLRRMTSVYEQQLELCERHQQEREISTLQLRDAKHNMKNNLVSILAYAEQEKYEYMSIYGVNTWAMSTYESRKSLIANYIRPLIGDMKLEDVTPRIMDKYYRDLLSVKAVSSKYVKARTEYLTPHTVREVHKTLRNAFNQYHSFFLSWIG